ncbi:MAG: hypothetical protein SCM96_14150 [Acidobacteriota bacterium]|nr:hypothetical protein [Acidobacteriota bacterium]
MKNKNWKQELKAHFDNLRVIESCKAESLLKFEQFCEFIAELAFESLSGELKAKGVRSKIRKEKGRSIGLEIRVPGPRPGNFEYRLILPRNSVDLKMTLRTRGRWADKPEAQETAEPFMEGEDSAIVLKTAKETIILDVIERYRNFVYAGLTSPD